MSQELKVFNKTPPRADPSRRVKTEYLSPKKQGYRNPRFDMIDSRIGEQNLWHTILNVIEDAHYDLFLGNNLDKAFSLINSFSFDEHVANMSNWLTEIVQDVAAYTEEPEFEDRFSIESELDKPVDPDRLFNEYSNYNLDYYNNAVKLWNEMAHYMTEKLPIEMEYLKKKAPNIISDLIFDLSQNPINFKKLRRTRGPFKTEELQDYQIFFRFHRSAENESYSSY